MRVVSITEAKNRLSALIDEVKAGGTVLIVDRGRPVATLESAVSRGPDEGGITRLERAGLARRGGNRVIRQIVDEQPPHADGGSVLEALLEERRGGR